FPFTLGCSIWPTKCSFSWQSKASKARICIRRGENGSEVCAKECNRCAMEDSCVLLGEAIGSIGSCGVRPICSNNCETGSLGLNKRIAVMSSETLFHSTFTPLDTG